MNPDLMLSVTGFMWQKGHFLLEIGEMRAGKIDGAGAAGT